eukprot:CAMPEP_0116071914 /NCGR_PEP_ID=MMETSP0322-20121206/14123_1 /TAXON_ID=163516 /ORGANISM="Leptocylindrus danicus var. apora, Strain B651" /LENGTH=32 /DNA_ID= /DNA_START= /DNA_END= /DNA_ORIENTATION=
MSASTTSASSAADAIKFTLPLELKEVLNEEWG